MAGLAPTVLKEVSKQALKKLLPAGAAGVGAGVANEIRKKQEASDEAKTTPVAGVQSKTETCTKDQKKCDECPPDKGVPWIRNFPIRHPWVDYQVRICGMLSGPLFITEWVFRGVAFDGFDSAECLLKEAKGRYDQFFDDHGQPKRWWRDNIEDMMDEINRQNLVSIPKPPVKLEWFWQEPLSYRYFSVILQPVAPQVWHHYQP
ncbi:Tox-REase-5 domain-containing protein [Janthinobacterium sp. CG_S6]|uniref:Tox-REase-5 domain-containing protein n=1 Tax=Janthinobacterium sp. CG_S6 TaxID=3071707 RepID=UPI002DFC1BA4|nr:hypothetical protein [Janthinobacterium sp. CG_S6]